MAKRESRTPEQIIKSLQLELQDKERELIGYRQEVAKINKQLEKFLLQMSSQLELAGLIQKALVPTEIPHIKGFEFSTKFVPSPVSGGDYFDIFELEDKLKFGVLVASTSGHGMAALFLSVLLKLTSQIEARKGMKPDEVLKHMAIEIQKNLKGDDSAHVFYAVIDRRTFNLEYSRSGDLYTYLYKHDVDKVVRLDATQPSISQKTKLNFKLEDIQLDPRDKLIIASRGAVTVKNSKGVAFGEERLFKFILNKPRATCHELRNEILYQVQTFAEGQDLLNDVSVLVMEVKDKIVRLKSKS